jgi:hypothetical protein
MRKLAPAVDFDNLTRWFLSVLFCATHDSFQGPSQMRDDSYPGGRWFWVTWDMDQSFRRVKFRTEIPWEDDTFQSVMERIAEARRGRRTSEPRAVIFTALMAGDPEYRELFKTIFVQVMNHRITPAFLEERFRYYEGVARTYGIGDLGYLELLRDFLERRPPILRRLAEQYLNTGPSVRCRIVAPPGVRMVIDGEPATAGYEGYYFPGMTLDVEIDAASRTRFSHWSVNGSRRGAEPRLRVAVLQDVTIEAVSR